MRRPPSFGYRWLKGELMARDDEWEIVLRIVTLNRSFGFGPDMIARYMEPHPRTGQVWTRGQVAYLIRKWTGVFSERVLKEVAAQIASAMDRSFPP